MPGVTGQNKDNDTNHLSINNIMRKQLEDNPRYNLDKSNHPNKKKTSFQLEPSSSLAPDSTNFSSPLTQDRTNPSRSIKGFDPEKNLPISQKTSTEAQKNEYRRKVDPQNNGIPEVLLNKYDPQNRWQQIFINIMIGLLGSPADVSKSGKNVAGFIGMVPKVAHDSLTRSMKALDKAERDPNNVVLYLTSYAILLGFSMIYDLLKAMFELAKEFRGLKIIENLPPQLTKPKEQEPPKPKEKEQVKKEADKPEQKQPVEQKQPEEQIQPQQQPPVGPHAQNVLDNRHAPVAPGAVHVPPLAERVGGGVG